MYRRHCTEFGLRGTLLFYAFSFITSLGRAGLVKATRRDRVMGYVSDRPDWVDGMFFLCYIVMKECESLMYPDMLHHVDFAPRYAS